VILLIIIIVIFIGQRIPGPKVKLVKDKFKYYILEKNGGYTTIKNYSEIMVGNQNVNLNNIIMPNV